MIRHSSHQRILVVCSTLLFLAALPAFSQGFLHASGNKIVNGSGQEIILRGIGLGGWLVPEGYMLQTSGFANSPTDFYNKVTALVGTANAEEFFRRYRENFVTKRDIDSIAAWGFNSIRLPMHFALLTPRDSIGIYTESEFARIDTLLAWCEAKQIYLILDLHCAPGGQNKDNISDYIAGQPSLWESTTNQTRTIALWKKLAQRYVNKQWIGGYDLINETVNQADPNNVQLRNFMVAMSDTIRVVDQNHILFIEGNWYATNFTGLSPAWDANMVYSFHKYWNPTDQNSIMSYLNLRSTTGFPLWLGETGENSNHWFTETIRLLENNKIGWAWWTWKKVEGINSMLSVVKTPEYDYLLRYWGGQVAAPTVEYAVNALNGFAEKLKIENCTPRRDVLDAMFRQPFADQTKPFADNVAPGIVFCVNYDMGPNLMAYKDNDYTNTNNGTTWNSGWQYRNDGVDIEKCTDNVTNGYDVGWTNTGEYMVYTIRVKNPGTYEIRVRYSSGTAGGSLLPKWDGAPWGAYDMPVTGGWQTWRTISLGQQTLTAGLHSLMLQFLAPGFNLNFVEFVVIDTTDVGDNIPTELQIQQNYPNPFNPTTNIPYSLPTDGFVTVKLFDTLGREIGTLLNEQQSAGSRSIALDADRYGLTSGVYLYSVSMEGQKTGWKRAVLIR
jgi:endoglucanase